MTASAISLDAWIAFAELAGPVLLVMLIIGLAAGVLQTATQVREASIPFVLKLTGMALLTGAAGPLMIGGVEHFTTRLLLAIPGLLHG
ncbi:MAG: flagellar biosynthetic protein FliQ [Acidocella sp.]|nr:flagellar biosynthetic protein FliQ [Acidocella sp.]